MPELDLIQEKEKGVLLESYESDRGTRVEMIQCPTLGIACYMDGTLQSCQMDEGMYHHALVSFFPKKEECIRKVLILGGGEGATAREVLRDKAVEHVDMYDWDEEVVTMFRERYPSWGKEAWHEEHLHVHYDDAFRAAHNRTFPREKYDQIVIDLFDLSEDSYDTMQTLLEDLQSYLEERGRMVMYVGMNDVPVVRKWITWCLEDKTILPSHTRYPYREFIPSFDGQAVFFAWNPR